MSERRPGPDPELPQVEEPSTLFILWPEAEAPLEEEVRLALEAGIGGIQWIDELESGGEVLWGVVGRSEQMPADTLIWAEERGELSSGMIADGLWHPEERERGLAAKWLVGVETFLDPKAPQASFQAQLRVLAHACVPGLVAVYDDNALVVRSGRQILDLALSDVPSRLSTLYAIHSVGGRGGSWLHTHGLGRAGLPEIELIAMPGDYLREGYELLDAVADGLMAGLTPAADGILSLHDDLQVRALPLEDAASFLPSDCAGGVEDRVGDEGSHGGRRLVLLDARDPGPPLRVLTRLADGGSVYKARGETDRQAALARGRWGIFGQLFTLRRGGSWRFHVKVGFAGATEPDLRENLWFEVLDLRPGEIRGRLISEPRHVADLRAEEVSWLPVDRLTDWLIVTPEGCYDPELASFLLPE